MESKLMKNIENSQDSNLNSGYNPIGFTRSGGQRTLRLETRARANDIKRLVNTVERVRKWEKRLVEIESTSLKLYKWVPVTNNP